MLQSCNYATVTAVLLFWIFLFAYCIFKMQSSARPSRSSSSLIATNAGYTYLGARLCRDSSVMYAWRNVYLYAQLLIGLERKVQSTIVIYCCGDELLAECLVSIICSRIVAREWKDGSRLVYGVFVENAIGLLLYSLLSNNSFVFRISRRKRYCSLAPAQTALYLEHIAWTSLQVAKYWFWNNELISPWTSSYNTTKIQQVIGYSLLG